MKRALAWAVALLLIFLILAYGYQRELDAKAQVGKPAPPITLPTLEGDLATYPVEGRFVLVNFFASWCAPCKDEIPLLQSLANDFPEALQVVGIAWRDSRGDAAAFAREMAIGYPILWDGKGKAARQYGLTGVPESWLIDPQGVAVLHLKGPLTAETDKAIRKLLEGAQP
ncbi:MAG: redoxin domain-containing protein [Clostridiales bacterium]|nr:redoxin domain-containing protein [Clostridiales bacterium]